MLLCVLFLCLGFAGVTGTCQIFAKEASESAQDCEITVSMGYGNHVVRLSRQNRASITVENRADTELKGYVTASYPFTDMKQGNVITKKQIVVPAGDTIQIEVPIYMGIYLNDMTFTVSDSKGQELATTSTKLTCISSEMMLVGLLSEDADSYRYFGQQRKTKLVELRKEQISESGLGLGALDMIVVGEYDLNELEQTQIDALLEWERAGGTLVLGGTKEKTAASLKALGEKVKQKDNTFDLPKWKDAYRLYDNNKNEENGKNEKNEKSEKNDKIGVYACSFDRGIRVIFCEDIKVSREAWEEAGEQYRKIVSEHYGQKADAHRYMDYYDMGELTNASAGTPKRQLPNIVFVIVTLVIYLLVITVGCRLFLKRIDQLEKIWICIPVCSVLCMVLIYVVGTRTRLTGVYMDYCNIVEYTEASEYGTVYSSMRVYNSENKNYSLKAPDTMQIWSGCTYEYDGALYPDDQQRLSNQYLSFSYDEQGTSVTFGGNASFEYNALSGTYQTKKSGTYSSDLICKENQYSGTFTNHMGVTMQKAVLLAGETVYQLGDIADGQTVEISKELPHANFPVSEYACEYGPVSKILTPGEKYTKKQWENNMSAYVQSIVSYLDLGSFKKKANEPQIICFMENQDDVMEQWNTQTNGETVYFFKLCEKQASDHSYELTDLVSQRTVIDDQDYPLNWISEKETIVDLQLHENEKVEQLCVYQDNNWIKGDEFYSKFKGEIQMYNYETHRYDTIFENVDKDQKFTKVDAYIDEDNRMRVRIKASMKQDEIDEKVQLMPIITASMREVRS